MTQATTTLEIGMDVHLGGFEQSTTIVSIKGRWVKLADGTNVSRAEAMEGRNFWLEEGHDEPKMETSMERLERIADEREIAEYEAGVATPEAPDTLEALVVADLFVNHGLLASGVTVEVKTGYVGPMVALRERAAAGAYRPALNGQPCCGDAVAVKLGTLQPAQVIRACIIAMALPSNPYLHLNIGQQSMNLRNKLRGCLKRGEFGMGVVLEAVEQIEDDERAISLRVAATQAAKYEAQAAA